MSDAFDSLGADQPQAQGQPAQAAQATQPAQQGDAFDTLGTPGSNDPTHVPGIADKLGDTLEGVSNRVEHEVGEGADEVAKKLHLNLVQNAIQGWHDPKAQLKSIPDSIKQVAGGAYEMAAAKMKQMHAEVAADQEVSKNAMTLMKQGQLREAAEMLNRHMAIRAAQHVGQVAGMGHSIVTGLVDDVAEAGSHLAHGEIGRGVADAGVTAGSLALAAPEETQAMKAAKAAEAATGLKAVGAGAEEAEAAPGILRPGTETVPSPAGDINVPARATGTVAKTAESVMPNARKAELQAFEANRTQPAIRAGVAKVTADAADLPNVASSATIEDPFGFIGHKTAIQAEFKPMFEAADEASDGAFSAAQKEADLARGSMDFEGKKAYVAAIQKQEDIIDAIKALKGKGETPEIEGNLKQMKAGWKKSIGMDQLADEFNRTVKASPPNLRTMGQADAGFVRSTDAFSQAIVNAKREGLFTKAGFTAAHTQAIEDLGTLLEKQHVKISDNFTNVLKSLVGGGIGGTIGGIVGGGVPGAVVGAGGEWVVGKLLSKIMTSETSVKTLLAGLKASTPATKIASTLEGLWKDQEGSLKIPFQGQPAEGSGLGKVIAGSADDVAAAASRVGKKEVNNASGESSASQEAINRLKSEKAQNVKRVAVDTRSGIEKPLIGTDAVDYKPQPYERVEFRGGDRDGEVIDAGAKARPYKRKSAPEAPAAPPVPEAYQPTQEGVAPKIPSELDRQPGRRISQRNPTAVRSTEDAVNGDLVIGRDAIKAADASAPGFMSKMAQTVAKYPGIQITPEEAMANPEKALDKFVNHIAGNLEFLHNQIPENIRNISKLWYDSAHVLTKNIAEKYGVAHEQVAAITAALSPKNEWNNNIELAKRVVDIYKTKQNAAWTPEMEQTAARLAGKNPDIADLTDLIRGKTLGELKDADEKAAWIRLYDESHNMSAKANYAPDGSVRGFARNKDNSISKSAWSALSPITKSVKILEDGSQENIHNMLGEAHKIRNFYNNIIDPWSAKGDVTIDTHAVGAAHLRPMSQKTEEVLHNFGSSFAPTDAEKAAGHTASSSIGSSIHGVNGTYALYADAYRLAAKRLGILPRELQSITWEGIRSLYEATGKTPELKAQIAQIWKQHEEGAVSIDRAQKQIIKAAGNGSAKNAFKDPGWLSDIKAAEPKK